MAKGKRHGAKRPSPAKAEPATHFENRSTGVRRPTRSPAASKGGVQPAAASQKYLAHAGQPTFGSGVVQEAAPLRVAVDYDPEAIPAPAFTCNAEGLITGYNRLAADLWGRSPKLNDAQDRYCGSYRLFSPTGEATGHSQCWMATSLRERVPCIGREIVIERPDGTRRSCLASAIPYYAYSGELTGALGTLIDVTVRNAPADVIPYREEERHALVAVSENICWTTDAEGKVLENSPSWKRYTGQTESEWLGDGWINAVHPDDRQGTFELWQQHLKTQTPYTSEYRLWHHESSSWRWVNDRAVCIREPSGTTRRWVGMVEDIHDRKVVSKANERMAAIITATCDAAVSIDSGGRILAWNRGAEQLFGYTAREIVGQTVAKLIPAGSRRESGELRQGVLDGKSIDQFETVRLRKDGSTVHVSITASPIKNPAGDVIEISAIVRDISKRKDAEETLAKILRATTPKTGKDYFHSLVSELCRICYVDYAIVSEIVADCHEVARTMAVSLHGRIVGDFDYELSGTPCETSKHEDFWHYPTNVQRQFPADQMLVEMGIDSYMGHCLVSSTGERIGLIGLMNSRPIPQPERVQTVLRVVAARAAAELERERAEQTLRTTQRFIERITTVSPHLIFVVNRLTDTYTYANRPVSRELGYGYLELDQLSDFVKRAMHPDDANEIPYRVQRWDNARDDDVFESICRLRNRDGTWTWYRSVHSVFSREEDGSVKEVLGIAEDITRLKETEHELLRTQFSVDHAAIAILWAGRDSEIRYVNPWACRMLGYTREELVGMSMLQIVPHHTCESWQVRFEDVKRKSCTRFESRYRRQDGTFFPVDGTVNFVNFDDQELVCTFAQDSTERSRVEERLEQQSTELLHVTRMSTMGQMVATFSHEIAQPLSAVSNLADACATRLRMVNCQDQVVTESVDLISKQVDRAAAIMRRVRNFLGDSEPKKTRCDLSNLMQDSIDLIANDFRRHNVVVRRAFARNSLTVSVDSIQMQQVVVNLLTNARDAMLELDPIRRVVVVRTEQVDGHAVFEVEDFGAGVPQDVIGKLFEPFVTTKESGMGIGLSICKSILKSHHGTIEAFNGEQHGATFRVRLPLIQED